MKKIVVLLMAAALLSACSSRKNLVKSSSATTATAYSGISKEEARRNNELIRNENQQAITAYSSYTVTQYIEHFKKIAIQEMNLYGIPASITLAQGLFESGFGNGELARVANNHFGIKNTSDWKGRVYYKDDDRPNDAFRVYNNPEDSYRDHSEFLKRKRYAHLFELDKNDYQSWAYGLKEAGYATNPNYPQLLINAIQKYQLDQYDRPEGEIQKIKREDRVLAQINQNIGKAVKDSLILNAPTNKLYTVGTGDTLYNISKRFGLTIEELKTLNNMADNDIKIGQKLVVSR
ncbi:LysM peptidoglycan-binding domain-containing protein [Mucilaginibacter robiniae]|uniref:Peptidoglycan hydrolase n=1 Tax=Mucilaginibacter robiniae TaxID=2728022 RepID=A0A7L5E0J6_9SPHI|nr:glucosaminidase domain-containing protein [Mucilaginibacter robiniae]QJD95809.1 LysM peptidoglycan-binding domain-containing protein [Mucilaginibacter robiniae]